MIRTRQLVLVLGVSLVPGLLAAQASQFGLRAFGLPSLPVSARSQGTAGAFGLFDRESAVNPASLTFALRPLATFTVAQHWRSSENRFGKENGRDTHFPLFLAAGPVGDRMAGSVSASVYTDRTFSIAFADTLILEGLPVVTSDTLASRGGITDLRAGLAYRLGSRTAIGVGLHVLTGSNRIEFRRWFSDSAYQEVLLRNELSFSGVGLSLGVLAEPAPGLQLAGLARLDGSLALDRDGQETGSVALPRTLGGGIQWQVNSRLLMAGHVIAQTWSRSDQDLRERLGAGAENTIQAAGGFEWIRSAQRPGRFPIRAGVRWAQLPFPVAEGAGTGTELAASLGTGFRFGGERGSLDVALERVWRREGAFREGAFALTLGVGVRP